MSSRQELIAYGQGRCDYKSNKEAKVKRHQFKSPYATWRVELAEKKYRTVWANINEQETDEKSLDDWKMQTAVCSQTCRITYYIQHL